MTITAARLQTEVGADTSGFDRGMGHADARIKSSGSFWSHTLSTAVGVGLERATTAIIRTGVRGLIGTVSAGVASLQAEGVVVAQTNAVIRSTAGAAHETAAEIRDLSNAVEDKTSIDDKQVQAGANMLLTFTNIRNEVGKGNDIFTQSVGVLADMSTAMGTDMTSGAVQLGKALNDPLKGITALTRVGVTFDDQQKARIKKYVEEGKTAEAQKIILAELNKEFGGSGAAFAATDAGQAAKFKDAIEGIDQAIAKGLLPTVTRVRGALDKFLRDPATLGQAQQLGDAMVGIFTESNLKTAAGLMTTAAHAVSEAVHLFAGLPPEVQALAVGAIALKKITGIGPLDIVKGASGVIGLVFKKGETPANPLFVADVTGGLGKGLGTGVAGAGEGVAAGAGGLTLGGIAAAVAAPLAAVAAVGVTAFIQQQQTDQQAADLKNQAAAFAVAASDADLATSITGVRDQLKNMGDGPLSNPFNVKGDTVDVLNTLIAEQNRRGVRGAGGLSPDDRQAISDQTKAVQAQLLISRSQERADQNIADRARVAVAAAATRTVAASRAIANEVRLKRLEATVTVTPTPFKINIAGKNVVSATVLWSQARATRNA